MNSFSAMSLHYQCAVLMCVFIALYHVLRALYRLSQRLVNSKGTRLPTLLATTGSLSLVVLVFMDSGHERYSAIIVLTLMQFLIAIALYCNHAIVLELADQGRLKKNKNNGESTLDIYDSINHTIAILDGMYAYGIKSLAASINRIRQR